MSMRCAAWVLGTVCLLVAGLSSAAPEEPSKAPVSGQGVVAAPGETNQRFARPEPQSPVLPAGPVAARPGPPAAPRGTTTPGPYQKLRALETKAGEARLQTPEGERTLHIGDHLGGDVVKAVDEGLLVLDRAAVPGQAGGDRRIVVRFDAQGRPSVRVYTTEDTTPVELPKVQ